MRSTVPSGLEGVEILELTNRQKNVEVEQETHEGGRRHA